MPPSRNQKRPIAVDLFSGAGGLALGFEQAGFDVVAAVELDPIHAAIHELNFPETTVLCRDIRSLTGDELRHIAGIGRASIDVVVGGPPCQGFSLIGHRVLDDPRNSLVFHFLRLVRELNPKTFVMENVPGMATGGHHVLLDELIGQFRRSGYRLQLPYQILDAADFGVPQARRRLFLLGARSRIRAPHYPTATVRAVARNDHQSQLTLPLQSNGHPWGPAVRDALQDLPNIEEFEELWTTDILVRRPRGGSRYARLLRGEVRDASDFSYARHSDPDALTGCLRADHTAESRRRFSATRPGDTEPISRFYRLPLHGLCNTLRAGTASDRGAFTAPRPIHPIYARCISVREAARLHSYPDWFRFHRTTWHGFRQIGNSVPPLLGRAVGAMVIEALGLRPLRPRKALVPGDSALASMNMREAALHFGVDARVVPARRRFHKHMEATHG